MYNTATLDCGKLGLFSVCPLSLQDDSPALYQEMEKGASDCSTLTKAILFIC